MQLPVFLQTLFEPWLLFLATDPMLRMLQMGMLLLGIVVVFLVFYATRDILLRTDSFFYMFVSILLVAILPVAGFFLYLLIRPSRTLKEREMEALLRKVLKATEAAAQGKKAVPRKKSEE